MGDPFFDLGNLAVNNDLDDAAGELLLTRILRAGDKYIAPAREDLVLMTGNAGALEVSVDGKVIPPLGPAGTVRRNVSLSAEKLLNGTAIQP